MSAQPQSKTPEEKDRKELRETGAKDGAIPTPSVPDPQSKKRPLNADEKVDEASLESMDGSDPPAFQPSSTGAAPDHKTKK